MKILLVEDNAHLGARLKCHLENEKHDVEWLQDGSTASLMAREYFFDVIILDLDLPQQHGFLILDNLRQNNIHTPILIFTALEDLDSRIRGLKMAPMII